MVAPLVATDSATDPALVAGVMLVVSIALVIALFEKAVASNIPTSVEGRFSPFLNLAVIPLGVAWITFATVLLGRGLAPA